MIIKTSFKPPDLHPQSPLIFLANHCSWWDGFFLAKLQNQLAPSRPLYTIMLESELRRFPFFRRIGAVGIHPENPGSVARAFLGLKEASERAEGEIAIAFFPQGQIQRQSDRPLRFRRGIELLAQTLAPVQVVPVALAIEPLKCPKPTAFIQAGEVLRIRKDFPVNAASFENQLELLLKIQEAGILGEYSSGTAPC